MLPEAALSNRTVIESFKILRILFVTPGVELIWKGEAILFPVVPLNISPYRTVVFVI
jgi:hypothetical protein